jgi:hypothetical protein
MGYGFFLISRESKRPHKFSSFVALMRKIIDSKPSTFEEVAKKKVWKDAIMEEYQSIMKNDVWEVVMRLEGKLVVTSKWVYKIKYDIDGIIEMYKTRFVARGFSHQEGEDYDETLSPVARRSVHRVAKRYMRRSLMPIDWRKICIGLSRNPG